jgi:hypothetical protein
MVIPYQTRDLIPFCMIAALAGCSTPEGNFPSLERRAFETDTPIIEPVAPSAPTELPAVLADKVSAITRKHQAASATFAKALPTIQRTASSAAGGAPGSEAWVNAHLQLSRVDRLRFDSVAALSELDELIADQINGDSRYVVLLVGAQELIAKDVADQKAEIERMSRLIGE